MKRFSFSLDRVLTWRRLQRDQERAKLDKLLSQRAALETRAAAIRRERLALERNLSVALHFDSSSVSTMPQWQRRVSASLQATVNESRQLEPRIEQQLAQFRLREREVRLLERLREKRLQAWQAEVSREEEAFAAEAYLARCIRLKETSRDTGA